MKTKIIKIAFSYIASSIFGYLGCYFKVKQYYEFSHIFRMIPEIATLPVLQFLWVIYGFEIHGLSKGFIVVLIVKVLFFVSFIFYMLKGNYWVLALFSFLTIFISFNTTYFIWAIMSV